MGNYGIKITQSGYDVSSATLRQLVMSSEYPFLKAYLQGTFSLTITEVDTIFTETINHSFGYPVKFVHYFSILPFYSTYRRIGNGGASAPAGDITFESWQDSNNIYMAYQDTTSGDFEAYPYTVYGYYYIFYDSIT